MIVTEKGKYVLLKDIKTSNAISIATIKKGTVLNITQIDNRNRKVIGEELLDWKHNNLPVKKLTRSHMERR
jgi:hypothetical protein